MAATALDLLVAAAGRSKAAAVASPEGERHDARIVREFHRWGLVRGLFQILAFPANLWAHCILARVFR